MGKMYLNGIPYSTEITESKFNYDLLLENTNFTPTTGTESVTRTYTLSNPIDNYDAVMVFGYVYCTSNTKNQIMSMTIMNKDFYVGTTSSGNTFLLNGTIDTDISQTQTRRLMFSFTDSTHIYTSTGMRLNTEEPRLWKVYGLKFPNETGIKNNDIPIYLGSQVVYPSRLQTNSSSRTNFYFASKNTTTGALNNIGYLTKDVVVPNGYEIQWKISAIFNSAGDNTCDLYVNETKLISQASWIGGLDNNAYLGHYGNARMTDLIRFEDIPTENRYIGSSTVQGFNFNVRSSINNQYVWIENVTFHAYLVKTYWH